MNIVLFPPSPSTYRKERVVRWINCVELVVSENRAVCTTHLETIESLSPLPFSISHLVQAAYCRMSHSSSPIVAVSEEFVERNRNGGERGRRRGRDVKRGFGGARDGLAGYMHVGPLARTRTSVRARRRRQRSSLFSLADATLAHGFGAVVTGAYPYREGRSHGQRDAR